MEAGAPCRTRTCDPRIRNPLLYPAELRAQLKSQLGMLLCLRVQARQGDLHPAQRPKSAIRAPIGQLTNISRKKRWKKRPATVNLLNYGIWRSNAAKAIAGVNRHTVRPRLPSGD